MFLQQLDLTTALRPTLYDDESLLFVQDSVGLYEGKFKLPNYQNGHLYLTSHRVAYVDNAEPRRYSVAIDLKEIDRTEFYAGFLKSSAKITLFPKPSKRASQAIKSPVPRHASANDLWTGPSTPPPKSLGHSPAPARNINATWICPICGFSNGVPSNFDPATANQHTPLPPCQACGIKPSLVHVVKAAIAAMSQRPTGGTPSVTPSQRHSTGPDHFSSNGLADKSSSDDLSANQCPRCTFQNHASLTTCEVCGARLPSIESQHLTAALRRAESPGPSLPRSSDINDEPVETIKFSFRAGGEKIFLEKLKGALVQRKWLLQSAPPIPRPNLSSLPSSGSPRQSLDPYGRSITPQARAVGIAGLERRGAEIRENAQAVIGSAFEDLEALMTSAKEVIAMAEQLARQTDHGSNTDSSEARDIISDSASALGLITTKEMLGSGTSGETLYITELARSLAEFLTDDRRGVLRKEGGIISLVDLWAVFNSKRDGDGLVSPLDFEKAATMWESLHLPIRLRRFKSGLLVVQEKSRTDEKTIATLLNWLRNPQYAFPPVADERSSQAFGSGVTAQETAEHFGWSVGVATEELEMAEEVGALCRDQCLDGTRYWENHLMHSIMDPVKCEQKLTLTLGDLAI